MKIKVFEAFAGYGSQCMALERLKRDYPEFDYELVGWSDIEPNAIKAHNACFPEASNYNFGDICTIDWSTVPDFDLFTYSFPCTDISAAGKQGGLAEGTGTRSSLLWECKRAIINKKPKYCLMENVPALVSKKFIDQFNKWVDFMRESGYSNYWQLINSKDYGVAQNRKRVFMVSILGGYAYQFPEPITLDTTIKDYLEDDVQDSYFMDSERVDALIKTAIDVNEIVP